MKKNIFAKYAAIASTLLLGVFLIYKAFAGGANTIPTVDFVNGPLLIKSQPSNIALALSIEFPTSGAAYRGETYEDGTEYVGYFNTKKCYTYPGYGSTPRTTNTFDVNTDFFTSTGDTNNNFYCNSGGTGTGFSGNYLNYATMSSPDIMRLALTGGDRGIDTTTNTVLDRGSVDYRRPFTTSVSGTIMSLVTPFTQPTVYAINCSDVVIFSTDADASCPTPDVAAGSYLGPTVPSTPTTGTSTATPTFAPLTSVGSQWTLVSGVLSNTAPTTGPQNATTTYTVITGGTSTTAPPLGAQNPTVAAGTYWTVTGFNSVDFQGAGAPNTDVYTNTSGSNRYVCADPGFPRIIRLGTKFNSAALASPNCPSGSIPAKISNNGKNYKNYSGVPYYATFTSQTKYFTYVLQTIWQVYIPGSKAIVKPRVQVCDTAEQLVRQVDVQDGSPYPYCQRYGTSYKPVGQLQLKADSVRVSVHSYLLEDSTDRYGGVLRAPMKYVGPNEFDANGNSTPNSQREWDPANGIFYAKPITDSVSTGYTYTGVINYLNRFGKSGQYKGYDPVGEIWYETLRYLQGLQPTPQAISGDTATTGVAIPEAMKDGYPVYTSYTDPVLSACNKRNYILGIGDVNTWYDKSLPGVTGVPREFDYPVTGTINGTSTTLDAMYWTKLVGKFESNNAVTYVDSLGRNQTTTGNPNPRSGLNNLEDATTGAGGSGYQWAGLAYWANTQPIRYDLKNSTSMKDIRVKTFMIDVDEYGDGSINPNRSFYIAGKYGYFNDKEQDGNPFKNQSAGGNKYIDWTGSLTGTEPSGYAVASQSKKLIAGLKKFFDDAAANTGSFSTVAVSSNSFSANSPDGKKYEPSYSKGLWSGTVRSVGIKLNTTTFKLEDGVELWDAGKILTQASLSTGTVADPMVAPDSRIITTYIRGSIPFGETFTYAALASNLPTAYNTKPYTSTTDSLGAERVNYLRGIRTKEFDNTFRLRDSVFGDIINSGPIYKAEANPKISGAGYNTFSNGVKSRTPVIYVGANDGMMHAIRATDGKEMFAYVPGAVLSKLPSLTAKNYVHDAFVDAVPVVDEAKVNGNWKTVLASGMGGGAQGIFALDVTNPDAWDKSKVMFEFTDADDADMGNVTSQPTIVKMKIPGSPVTYKYYLVVSSGYNNYKDDGFNNSSGDQALFLLSLDKPIGDAWTQNSNYFKIMVPITDATKRNGLAQPGIKFGAVDEVLAFYAGDLQGNLWKFDFSDGLDTTKASNSVKLDGSNLKAPIFIATNSSIKQPITSAPVIYPYPQGGDMVVFGSGRFLDTADITDTGVQSIYGVWDSGNSQLTNFKLGPAKLVQLTATAATSTIVITGSTTIPFTTSTGGKRGWFFNLPLDKERVVVDGVSGTGYVSLSSTIPPEVCGGGARGINYLLSPSSGSPVGPIINDGTEGLLGKSIIINVDLDPSSTYGTRDTAGGRTATSKEIVFTQRQSAKGDGSEQLQNLLTINFLRTGRIYWREVRDFNKASTSAY